MVGHLSARIQERLLGVLMSASEGRGDDAADVLIELGERRADFDETARRREILLMIAASAGAMLAVHIINTDRSSRRHHA